MAEQSKVDPSRPGLAALFATAARELPLVVNRYCPQCRKVTGHEIETRGEWEWYCCQQCRAAQSYRVG